MTLLQNLKVKVTPAQEKQIMLIDEENFSQVRRKVQIDVPSVTDEFLDNGIENLKRYYVVHLLEKTHNHGVSFPVDEFWHSHVLHTYDYFRFCETVYGEYIHHQPLDQQDEERLASVKKVYAATRRSLEEMFQGFDANWWPSPERPMSACCTMIQAH